MKADRDKEVEMVQSLGDIEIPATDAVVDAAVEAGVDPVEARRIMDAIQFLDSYEGSFGFLLDMQSRMRAYKKLSPKQIDAVLRCKVQEDRFQAERTQRSAAKPATQAEPVVDDGIYFKDGKVYKVQHAVHGSGRQYAKVLDNGHFEFAKGMVFKLTPDDKMTLEQAKEYGALYGVCCNCGATLTDENSIAAGIGPVCAAKFA